VEHWTAQTDEDHDLELAKRHLVRTERDRNEGWASDDELDDARREVERAMAALDYRVLMRVDWRVAYEARRMARAAGVVR
jgi:hypothetical protein